jgi:hypothetical protein
MYLELNLVPPEVYEESETVSCDFCGAEVPREESYRDSLFCCLCEDCLKNLHRRNND